MANYLSKKERFDALMKLADFWLFRWNSRRTFEWRVSFSLWIILIAATVGIKNRPPDKVLIPVLVLVVIGHSLLWVREMYIRNHRDHRMALYYFLLAERILLSEKVSQMPDRPDSSYSGLSPSFWRDGIAMFQVVTTTFLSTITFSFMGRL